MAATDPLPSKPIETALRAGWRYMFGPPADATDARKLWGVEACRGFAALMVVFVHMNMWTIQAVQSGAADFRFWPGLAVGRTGVDFFFVLSGFIIMYVHESDIGRPDRFRRYIWRRITRLAPLYWSMTAVTFVLYAATGGGHKSEPLTLLKSLFFIPQDGGPTLGNGWSLEHEMLFYLIFGALIFSKRLGIAVMAVWAGVVAWRYGVGELPLPGDFDPFGFHLQFFLGMGAALLVRRYPTPLPALVAGLGAALFFGGWVMDWTGVYVTNSLAGKVTFGVAAMLIILGVAQIDHSGKFATPQFFRMMGRISYSLYLVHGIVLIVLGEVLQRLGLFIYLGEIGAGIVAVSASVAAAWLVNRFIEVPLSEALRSAPERLREMRSGAR